MTTKSLYYQESGKIGASSILLMIGAGLLAGAVLGAIYGYAIFYIPFIYLNFFITVFFGIGVGMALGKTGYFTKVRNKQAMMIIGAIFGLIADYFGWVFWINALSERTFLSFDPAFIFEIMGELANNGAWSIFGWTPTGGALYLVWAIEALIIIIATALFSASSLGDKPFCEECDSWTEEEVLTSNLAPITDPATFVSALEQNNLTELTKMKNVDPSDQRLTRVQVFKCPCSKSHYLSVEAVHHTVNDKGELESKETPIMQNFILNGAAYQEITTWSTTLDEPELEAEADA